MTRETTLKSSAPSFTSSIYAFLGRRLFDISALSSSIVVFAGGIYLAWHYKPVWLNRAGSLIIIIGVLLAASRFHEWIQQKVMTFFDKNYHSIFEDVMANFEKARNVVIPKHERDKLESSIRPKVDKGIDSLIEVQKRRLKLYEVYLVVIGTFLNGWGDYIICLLKNCGN